MIQNKERKLISILIALTLIIQMTACRSIDSSKENDINTSNEGADSKIISIGKHPAINDHYKEIGKRDALPEMSFYGIDIRSTDLSEADLTDDLEALLFSSFDSKTIWPNKLPEGFDIDFIMENDKNPGLGIRSLHDQGITGENVGIGIIDQVLLVDHVEYKEQLRYYKQINFTEGYNEVSSPHGSAVSSIAVGKTVGVAPKADLYYIGIEEGFGNPDTQNAVAEGINTLLDLNKELETNEKIRVISISWGGEDSKKSGYEELIEAYERATSEGVFVITAPLDTDTQKDAVGNEFVGLSRGPLTDPERFDSYWPTSWEEKSDANKVHFPMGFRCTASPTGLKDYAVHSIGGISWVCPYIAGTYALACQVDPSVTPDRFWKVAKQTAVSNNEVANIINPIKLVHALRKK